MIMMKFSIGIILFFISIGSIFADIIIRPNFIGVETSLTTRTSSTSTTSIAASTASPLRTLPNLKNLELDLEKVKLTRLSLALISERTDFNNSIKLFWSMNNRTINVVGYQVFVREFAFLNRNKSASSSNETHYENRQYYSKIMSPKQNRYKIKNLLRSHETSFSICLVIFIDLNEMVLEKKCINFTLSGYADNSDSPSSTFTHNNNNEQMAISTSVRASTFKTTPSHESNTNVTPHGIVKNKLTSFKYNKLSLTNFTLTEKLFKNVNNILNSTATESESSLSTFTTSLSSFSYTSLLIAFVICIALLGANVFMFTIIIIQNAIKLNLLKSKIKLNKINGEFYSFSNHESNKYSISNSKTNNDFEIETRSLRQNAICDCCCLSSFCGFFAKICCDCVENDDKTSKTNNRSDKKRKKSKRRANNKQANRKDILKRVHEPKTRPKSPKTFLNKIENHKFRRPSIIQSVSEINRDGYIINLPRTNINPNRNNGSLLFEARADLHINQIKNGLMNYDYNQFNNYHPPPKPPSNINYKSSFSNDIFFHVPNRFDGQMSSAF